MIKSIHDILKQISELKTTKEKVEALQSNRYKEAIKTVFYYTYSPQVEWLLPQGDPPYKPCEYVDVEGRFLSELKKLYLFVQGGNPNLTTVRREFLFIQMLESIFPEDAKLLLAMKDRKMPFKGITKKIANQAFPELQLIEEVEEASHE